MNGIALDVVLTQQFLQHCLVRHPAFQGQGNNFRRVTQAMLQTREIEIQALASVFVRLSFHDEQIRNQPDGFAGRHVGPGEEPTLQREDGVDASRWDVQGVRAIRLHNDPTAEFRSYAEQLVRESETP